MTRRSASGPRRQPRRAGDESPWVFQAASTVPRVWMNVEAVPSSLPARSRNSPMSRLISSTPISTRSRPGLVSASPASWRTPSSTSGARVPGGETQRGGTFEHRPHAARRRRGGRRVARARRGERPRLRPYEERVRLDGEREAASGQGAPHPHGRRGEAVAGPVGADLLEVAPILGRPARRRGPEPGCHWTPPFGGTAAVMTRAAI